MKTILSPLKFSLFLLISPFFMAGFCSKDDKLTTAIENNEQYFTYSINGVDGSVSTPKDSLGMTTSNNFTKFQGFTKTSTLTANYRMSFTGSSVGDFQAKECVIYVSGRYFVITPTPINIKISNFGGLGSFVTGSYSGPIKDSTTGNVYNANGQFKIKNW
jgi:hypothetical protein